MAEIELSTVVPLYNEERNVERVAGDLVQAFRAGGIAYELVLVNNGSRDRTPEIIRRLAAEDPLIRPVQLEKNAGYGGGILAGLQSCRGPVLGYTWGDGQVSAEDLVAIFRKMKAEGLDLCKACRVERHDGMRRKIVTTVYNRIFPMFFPCSSRDVNGCPKIFTRPVFERLGLSSRDWFIDAEIMIKAERMKLRVGEVPVVFRARTHGASNVRLSTIVEFIGNMVRHKMRGTFAR